MQSATRVGVCWSCATALIILLLSVFGVSAQDGTNAGPKSTNETAADAQSLRAYLQLQEQVHAAALAIEQNRQEATAAVQRNAELVSARLKLIEQALSMQREREAEVLQKSNRMMIATASVFGTVGLLAMVLTAIFLIRTMNRLTDISAAIPKLVMGPTPSAGSGLGFAGDSQVIALPADSTRLLGAIERLEKRILELESGTPAPQLLPTVKEATNGNGNGKHAEPVSAADAEVVLAEIDPQERVSVILGKGQTLLNLGQSENALVCFDEVLAADPGNAEALVKKGTALERLRRWEEALQCYDRAIAANSEMTLAYLYKGGVFNQLERFSEALECYEQALRTQQKSAVPA